MTDNLQTAKDCIDLAWVGLDQGSTERAAMNMEEAKARALFEIAERLEALRQVLTTFQRV